MSTAALLTEQPTTIGRPRKFVTIEELQDGIDAYFVACKAEKTPFTIEGLAEALDTSRQTLLEYEGRVEGRQTADERFADAIKGAKRRIQRQWAEGMLSRNGQVAGHIFYGKNNFGYRDTQEIEHTHTLIAIGQPGGMLPQQLEPPCIDVTPIAQIANENEVLAQAGNDLDEPS